MLMNSILSWGMIVTLSSLFLSTGSVDRNSTLSHNNNPASHEEVKEAKGCATNFGKRTDLMFKYVGPDYTQDEVEKLENWEYKSGNNPIPQCNDEAQDRACVIFVSINDVTGTSPNYQLDPSLILSTKAKSPGSDVFHILGANVTIDFYNEEDL